MRFVTSTAAIAVLSTLPLVSSAQEPQWARYMAKKEQRKIFSESMKRTNLGKTLLTASLNFSATYWVTESMARAAISEMIDRERIEPEEAEKRYQDLRSPDSYFFLIDTLLYSPVDTELFLQRAGNRKIFSKGTLTGRSLILTFGTPARRTVYMIEFPRTNRAGDPIVTNLSDTIEIQFTTGRKTVIFKYKIKDLVTKLEDL